MSLFDYLRLGLMDWETLLLVGYFLSGALATFVFLWLEQHRAAATSKKMLGLLRSQLAKGRISVREYNCLRAIL